jgi:hypothetical protein
VRYHASDFAPLIRLPESLRVPCVECGQRPARQARAGLYGMYKDIELPPVFIQVNGQRVRSDGICAVCVALACNWAQEASK